MDKIKLGNTDLQISKINFGGNVFGWTLDEAASFKMLDALLDAGINFIDTADSYSWWIGKTGISETIIGKWMKSRGVRDKIVLATKVGSQISMETSANVSKAYILKTIDESLKRLQTDYIDLYYSHFDDNTTPVEETLSAFDEVIKAGKVRHIGASNITTDRLKASFDASDKHNLPRYEVLQPHYNLVERKMYETEYAALVEKYGMVSLPYFSLASGFLTGKYRTEEDFSKSIRGGGAKAYLNDKGFSVLKALDSVAAKHNSTPAAVSLAWLLNQKAIAAPLVSATKEAHLEALIQAPKLKLDMEDLHALSEASKY